MSFITSHSLVRRLPVGAEPQLAGGVHFRVWAPEARNVCVELAHAGSFPLTREAGGYFAGAVASAAAGTRYRFRLDERGLFADPASRFQPDGPFGPSEVVDANPFPWTDAAWSGLDAAEAVLYELHVGTFTSEGTWAAAAQHLQGLADLSVTAVEVMPVADFPGRFGWGYDGVCLFAPTRLYGTPDEFRRFVDTAHRHRLGVLLDVVYNHVGPAGSVLRDFAAQYLSPRQGTDWGPAFNFDLAPVREFLRANVEMWLREYHLDGFRFDAVHGMQDDPPEPPLRKGGSSEGAQHILAELVAHARAAAGSPGSPRPPRPRRIMLIAESAHPDERLLLPPDRGGPGFDLVWSDDLHHCATVFLTPAARAYYQQYTGGAQQLLETLVHGRTPSAGETRIAQKTCGADSVTHDAPTGFEKPLLHNRAKNAERASNLVSGLPRLGAGLVAYLENHDLIAGPGFGRRWWQEANPARRHAMTALWLLSPATPMFFQGQEFGASSQFYYFADHAGDLARRVAKGRREFLSRYLPLAAQHVFDTLPDPHDPRAFAQSKLSPAAGAQHSSEFAFTRTLLALRRRLRPAMQQIQGQVLAEHCLALRYGQDAQPPGETWLLLASFGRATSFDAASPPMEERVGVSGFIHSSPLFALPAGWRWEMNWCSDAPECVQSAPPSPPTPLPPWGRGEIVPLTCPADAAVLFQARPQPAP